MKHLGLGVGRHFGQAHGDLDGVARFHFFAVDGKFDVKGFLRCDGSIFRIDFFVNFGLSRGVQGHRSDGEHGVFGQIGGIFERHEHVDVSALIIKAHHFNTVFLGDASGGPFGGVRGCLNRRVGLSRLLIGLSAGRFLSEDRCRIAKDECQRKQETNEFAQGSFD